LKKGTGSEQAIANTEKHGGREVPVPFFNRLLGMPALFHPQVLFRRMTGIVEAASGRFKPENGSNGFLAITRRGAASTGR
jgi:hypothetical protein